MTTTDTPQLDRWEETFDQRGAIIGFLEESGYELCVWGEETGEYEPVARPLGAVLDEHFGIDPAAIEAERRALLEEARLIEQAHRRGQGGGEAS